ncbi:hypothetical protein [Alkalinema sp. FACHB-956]|uniref:hypothetical protein n=1 Tax=Alkalinema sp. FACHB-956 TaxID=2692768 RepID=UPI0016868BC8|nr:hypothetical protein [Alkalinema sp. FACHB-956]MBD2327295.1 hypothetical protein [Alkalinema sp. FACHB-956]
MPIVRLVSLLVLTLGLAIFTWQNFSTSLPLVFFGVALGQWPLSLWLLLALLLGSGTSFAITALLKLSTTAVKLPRWGQRSGDRTRDRQQNRQASRDQTRDRADWDDDWGTENPGAEDWDDDWDNGPVVDRPQPAREPQPRQPVRQDVVDAEFRVIVPPSRNLEDDR